MATDSVSIPNPSHRWIKPYFFFKKNIFKKGIFKLFSNLYNTENVKGLVNAKFKQSH